ncbi:MAG: AMP-binding protein [Pseudomonadota bacterium]
MLESREDQMIETAHAEPWRSMYTRAERAFQFDSAGAPDITEFLDDLTSFSERDSCSIVLPNGASATLSYNEVDAYSDAFARFLIDRYDIQTGDVVAMQAPNCLAYVIALFATLKAGGIVSNVNPLYTASETLHQIDDCQAKILIGADLFADRIGEISDARPDLEIVLVSLFEFFPAPRRAVYSALLRYIKRALPKADFKHATFRDALRHGHLSDTPLAGRARAGDEVSFYQYSGGTTGRSKGVELTASGLLGNIEQCALLSDPATPGDNHCCLLALPMYHMFGLFMCASVMRRGGHVVLIPSPRPISNMRKAFEKFSPTIFPGVNTLFARLLNENWFQASPPQSIQVTYTGATALDPDVAARWKKLTGSKIGEAYGMTEATCVLTMTPLDDRHRAGTVGLPLPGVDIRIVDAIGNDCPTGAPGEILARGPQVMLRYHGHSDTEGFVDGWLKTGDVGSLDEQGFLTIHDRVKDMLLVSGFNVFPAEVEEVITSCDGVLEAGVVGTACAETGEQVVAFVVRSNPAQTEDQIMAHCREHLAAYKCPKIIRFIDELPKSPVGKVLRRELRDMA